MNKRERVLAVLQHKDVDYIPGSFWFHFTREEDTVGEGAVQAHLNYYRSADLDFIKIMSDGLGYPLKVRINSPEDWYKVEPLPKDDPFFADTIQRCRRINEELKGECCTFYNMFSPFNIVRERDVFTPECLNGRSWDATVMAHLRFNEKAIIHAMNVIAEDLAYLAQKVIVEGHCDGIYQSVQGAEIGRMTAEEYARIVAPTEMKVIAAANEVSDYNILHMCSWAGNRNHLSYWKDYPVRVKNWGTGVEGVSLAEGKQLFGGAVLLGGMDNRRDQPLYSGTREEIQAAVRRVIREMDGTPFLLGADCTVPPDTDLNHIRWALEAARTYGK